jgi:hypothetical protein
MGWDDDGNFINETERRSAPEPKAERERQTVEFGPLTEAFREQLLACLEECAGGRRGLFSDREHLEDENSWPEAAQLRQLAFALQGIMAQSEESDVLCDQFLDLCSIHGESDPGEPRLARAFLNEIAGRG